MVPGAASSGLRGREAAETYVMNLSPGAQSCRSLEFPVQGGSDHNRDKEDRGSQLRELGSRDTGQLKLQGETTAVTEARVLSSLKHLIYPSNPREPHWRNGGTPCPLVPPLATARGSKTLALPDLLEEGPLALPGLPGRVLLPFAVFPVHGSWRGQGS